MSNTQKSNALGGKDLITIGIFSAIYFVLNFICMLISSLHPLVWILMPMNIAIVTGIPFLLLCAKVQKFGTMALSGGQKQCLAIAAAVLSRRPVLIFDEPTSGLDYRSMCRVSALIRKLSEDGRTVIVVSHDREFMRLTCDCEIRLAKGENPYGRT